uniref:Dynein axonemal assembly factor 11-like CS domain-containing protein n=1 Tax=Rhodnius prolixus TaxID=13249 RepID=T1HSB9_RHOPR
MLANWYKTRTDEDFRSDYEDEEDDDDHGNMKNDEANENFWSQTHKNCPEVRIELAKQRRLQEKAKQEKKPPKKKPRRLFNDNGEPLNVNQPKIHFTLDDDYWNNLYTLDVAVYKHLDTALINADVNPFYVRVLIKGKVLQLRLDEEVCPDKSIAKRSQTTGHLLITMPKVKEVIRPYKSINQLKKENKVIPTKENDKIHREYLEVQGEFDLKKVLTVNSGKKISFIDNPEVPPLE